MEDRSMSSPPVSSSLSLSKASSHSRRQRRMNTSTTSLSTISLSNTGRKSEDSPSPLISKTSSSKCLAKMEIKDQLSLSSRPILGCLSHTQSRWQDSQSWTRLPRRELRRLHKPPTQLSQGAEVKPWTSSSEKPASLSLKFINSMIWLILISMSHQATFGKSSKCSTLTSMTINFNLSSILRKNTSPYKWMTQKPTKLNSRSKLNSLVWTMLISTMKNLKE